ncbi:ribokinase [Arthrobacter sp. Hiyo8]|nr:ribokinase [Arthrobacter sp. Hiyo8]
MNRRIVVVGSLNADLTIYCERLPLPGETVHGNGFAVNPGGKSANQAVAASKLGGTVTLIGAVGNDSNGDMLLTSTEGSGVDVSRVRRSADDATGVAVIAVDANGENNIIISAGANGTLAPADVPADAFDDAAVLCLCLEVSLETVEAAAKTAHDAGATVLLNLSPYAEIPQSLAALSDVLLVNAHEASMFLGDAEMPHPGAHASAWEPVRSQFAERGWSGCSLPLARMARWFWIHSPRPGNRSRASHPPRSVPWIRPVRGRLHRCRGCPPRRRCYLGGSRGVRIGCRSARHYQEGHPGRLPRRRGSPGALADFVTHYASTSDFTNPVISPFF